MRCPSCNHDNSSERRFCGECGAGLAVLCASCGTANGPSEKFCGGCGAALRAGLATTPTRSPASSTPKHLAEKILTSRAALEGERKQVTVLFADVKGSMELAEQMDPEAWSAIMQRFFTILAEGVQRFEGFVDKFTGDGIMALFGAPIAHEDHAQRACYAALHLRTELARYGTEVKRTHGVGFSTRTGIHSGEVVVGKIGDDLRMDYTAQGHTVGLAQRMEALASPDTCYLTGATAALVQGYFELEDLGDFQVKGCRRPSASTVWSVRARRARASTSRAAAVSRASLAATPTWRRSRRPWSRRRPDTARSSVSWRRPERGRAGCCFEFAQRCRARGMTVNEGHAVAHGKNIPYLPILQVFRGYYGIAEQDDDRTAREKIAGRLLLLDETFREVLPVLFDSSGAGPGSAGARMDPEPSNAISSPCCACGAGRPAWRCQGLRHAHRGPSLDGPR